MRPPIEPVVSRTKQTSTRGLAATGKVGLWGYIGVVPLLTGAVGFCPLYSALGLNTCPVRR